MNDDMLKRVNGCLCKEFQSIWIVDAETETMIAFSEDYEMSVPGAIDVGKSMAFSLATDWYVNNCVIEADRKRIREGSTLRRICEKLTATQSFNMEYTRINNGKLNYNQLVFARLDDNADTIHQFLLGFRDIDVRKKAERDDLTGVYTRQMFFQKAEELLASNPDENYIVMISDIVDFKLINESYGMKTGDRVLQKIGTLLAGIMSEEVIVGRYGADQFVTILSEKNYSQIHMPTKSTEISNFFTSQELPKLEVKFGIYTIVSRKVSIIAACEKAKTALNSIKHQYGKMISAYDDKIRQRIDVIRRIESSMRESLEENDFKVYYQPKHDATTGKLIGAEALIRWIHPEYGFMSPGDFIPIFERNGFVVETDFFVWERTCQNLRKWREKGLATVPISVNSSKLTFQREDMLEKMKSFVENNHLHPDQLHIEITETMMEDDHDALRNKLIEIRNAGYRIELDDFGSGYSSINILSAFPLDVIKLDMSFMRQFGDESRTKVLAACIKLAKDLGYSTISEGVEKNEQREVLNTLGVDAIQGYVFSKPLPEEEFEEYLSKYM